jgi:hypothetical protein
MTKVNANALFQGLRSKASFTKTITVHSGDPEEAVLLSARADIRAALKQAFANFRPNLLSDDVRKVLLLDRDQSFQKAARSVQSLDIRFLTQGSYAYQTLIRPAKPPRQEIDLDDGVYVPMPFVNGRPLFSSDGLFGVIERALTPLVKAKGWSFQRKSTCIRVCLTGQNAHIDLPLFAVEQSEFQSLSDLYEKQFGRSFRQTDVKLSTLLDTDARKIRLDEKKVLLADRDQDWRHSDPKAIHDWFEDQVRRYGPVLRRACRYLKDWRDELWTSCCLSSLVLMVACVDALAALGSRPAEDRDDLVALQIAKSLPERFRRGGIVWRVGESPLDGDWTPEERERFVEAAEHLSKTMSNALDETFVRDLVISRLQEAFGPRFPNAPESLDISAAGQRAVVLETKAATVAMPVVGTSASG